MIPSMTGFAVVSQAWWRAVYANSHFAFPFRHGMRSSSVSRRPLCDLQSTSNFTPSFPRQRTLAASQSFCRYGIDVAKRVSVSSAAKV